MSKQTIQTKIEQIRNETQQYANTRGRVADTLTLLNTEKLDRDGVLDVVDEITNIAPEFFEYLETGVIVGQGLTQLTQPEAYTSLSGEGRILSKFLGYKNPDGSDNPLDSAEIGKYLAAAGGYTADKELALNIKAEKGDDGANGLNATANIPAYGSLVFPISYPSMYTYGDRLYQVKSGQVLQSTDDPEDGTKVQLIKGTPVINQTVDPSQIVPTEAMLNYPANVDTAAGESEVIAYDVLKRVDDGTRTEQIYKETTTNIDGVAMTDAMLDGFAYIKRGVQYFMNSDFALKREVYLDSYGLAGDGVFRSIATVFPEVTLAEVQALNPNATLANSADWFMLMKLNRDLPVNSVVYLTGAYVIDEEWTIRRSSITWEGHPYKRSSKYPSDKKPYIKQIAAGKNAVAFRDGDGLTNYYPTKIEHITFKGFDIHGTLSTDTLSGHGILIDIPNGDMMHCKFINTFCYRNGKSGFYHESGHINDVEFYYFQAVLNFDTGIWFNGRPAAQTNFFNFKMCSASVNGFVIRNGELAEYNPALDGVDYTKGGASFGNLSSTHWDNCNTQSNYGFGFMAREGAAIDGLNITGGYSEMNPLGDYVMFCQLESSVIMNTNCQHPSIVYFEGDTLPPAGHFSVFKTREHYRRFIPSAGVAHNRKLAQLPWSDNIITNPKTRELFVGGGTFTHSYSTDATGAKVLNVVKTGGSGLTYVNFLAFEEYSLIPKVENTQEGTVFSFSFDIKFDVLTGVDVSNFGYGTIAIRGFVFTGLFQLPNIPAADGSWSRVHLYLEYDGTPYETGQWTNPIFFIDGVNNINLSIRNPQFKIKSEQTYLP